MLSTNLWKQKTVILTSLTSKEPPGSIIIRSPWSNPSKHKLMMGLLLPCSETEGLFILQISQDFDNKDLILITADDIVYRTCEITVSLLCLAIKHALHCTFCCSWYWMNWGTTISYLHVLCLKTLLQVEQSQAGLKSLSFSEKTVNQIRENFLSIEKYVKN